MARPSQLHVLGQGVALWDAWRAAHQTLRHLERSPLDKLTIARSGELAEGFLQGCGLT